MSFLDELYKTFEIVEVTPLNSDNEDNEGNMSEIYNRLTMNLPEECKFILENYEGVTLELPHSSGYELTIALSGSEYFLDDLMTLQDWPIEEVGNVVPIANDIGETLYLYGMGNEGMGLYLAHVGALHKDEYVKLADSISDFFCKGIGIDKLI